MGKIWCKGFCILIALASLFCKEIPHKKEGILRISADSLLQIRYQKFLDYPIDSISIPRSYDPKTKKVFKVASKDWTSGFYPGNLWQLYKLTGK
ncbi:MAG: hypothetical protein ABJP59_10005, partial [Maribacter dokdonensis]